MLDEISEMDLSLQAKLLRVLQEREVERLGSRKSIKLDVRVLATSNRDLKQYVSEGNFREDLYYRLNVFPITWPALCERKGDIEPLAKHLVERHCTKLGMPVPVLSEQAINKLVNYPWPGNVRELVNVVERAVVLSKDDLITAHDLPEQLRQEQKESPGTVNRLAGNPNLKSALADPERQIIIDALEQNGWNRQDTARLLGINRTTLYKKMKKYDITYENHAQIF